MKPVFQISSSFIQRIVCHHDTTDARDVEHLIDVLSQSCELKNSRASFRSSARVSRPKTSSTEINSLRCFRRGRVVYEQSFPNEVGLIRFRHRPELVGRNSRGAKCFGHEIVISQQLINSKDTIR